MAERLPGNFFEEANRTMESGQNEYSLLIAETSEWFDWLRRDLRLGGISLPCEETSVFFIERALHAADRVRGTYRHLPDALRYKLIKASIIYQCWENQKGNTEKAAWKVPDCLPAVAAVSYVGPLGTSGRHHLFDASDGFRYVVTLPKPRWTETLPATEMICNELARLFGLAVPSGAVVSVGAKELRLADVNSNDRPEPRRHGSEPCCGFRYLGSERSPEGARSLQGRWRKKQLRGALVFDIWTLNLATREFLPPSRSAAGQPEVILLDHSHCLSGSKWAEFEDSAVDSCPSPQSAAADVRSLDELWPWVREASMMDLSPIWEIASQIPPQWYGGRRAFVASMLEKLSARRGDLIHSVQLLARKGYFPGSKIQPAVGGTSQERDGATGRTA
jgi:hypothetical protein